MKVVELTEFASTGIHLKFLTELVSIQFQKLRSPRQRYVKELTPFGDAAIQAGCFYSS